MGRRVSRQLGQTDMSRAKWPCCPKRHMGKWPTSSTLWRRVGSGPKVCTMEGLHTLRRNQGNVMMLLSLDPWSFCRPFIAGGLRPGWRP